MKMMQMMKMTEIIKMMGTQFAATKKSWPNLPGPNLPRTEEDEEDEEGDVW